MDSSLFIWKTQFVRLYYKQNISVVSLLTFVSLNITNEYNIESLLLVVQLQSIHKFAKIRNTCCTKALFLYLENPRT